MDEQTPTVGRIVHYHEIDVDQPQAAIITKVHSNLVVNLTVLSGETADAAVVRLESVSRADTPADHVWTWPPRA